jgi:hypothetical protein
MERFPNGEDPYPSIYAFKGGFKRHNARFYNGETRFMHLREALKGIMPDLIMESISFFFFSFFVHIWHFKIINIENVNV